MEKTKADQLREILGNQEKASKSTGSRNNLQQAVSKRGQLTLYELGALIVVAGTEAGFDVCTECAVHMGLTPNGNPRTGKLDCAWYSKKTNRKDMLVAWEIDAQDVAAAHLEGSLNDNGVVVRFGNRRKFTKSKAKIKVQALYSIRGHLLVAKPHAADCFPDGGQVTCVTDVQLMGTRLNEIVDEAKGFDKNVGISIKLGLRGHKSGNSAAGDGRRG
jgi:hypothetical protein